jgi:hypothetical protein
MPQLKFSRAADEFRAKLENDAGLAKQFKAVRKALGQLELNPWHPGLNSKPWHEDLCPHGDTLYESYAQNKTPGAYRIWWCYLPDQRNVLWVVAIGPHP